MDLKERIDINIVDLINRIDRLTSGNVGHAKTQLKFQIKKIGEFVTELCDNQKSDTGDRQLTIPVIMPSYLRERRQALNMSMQDVTNQTNISKATISRLELGNDAYYNHLITLHQFYSDNEV